MWPRSFWANTFWPSSYWPGKEAAALAEGIAVERSPDGVSGWQEIGRVALGVQAYADADVLPSTTYHYRARQFDPFTFSDYSNIDDATTGAAP